MLFLTRPVAAATQVRRSSLTPNLRQPGKADLRQCEIMTKGGSVCQLSVQLHGGVRRP